MVRPLVATSPGLRRRDGLALAASCIAARTAAPLHATWAQASPLCRGDEALCRLVAPAGLDHSNTHAVLVEHGWPHPFLSQ